MEERKVQRRPFRTLGMRMQNFGRQLIHNYVASTNMSAPSELPPTWRDDTETPLIWRKFDEGQQIEDIDGPDQGMDRLPQVDFTPQPPARQPVRRKPAPAQSRKSEAPMDPRLSQILAFHQRRQGPDDTPVQEESRPASPPPEDIRRQADEGRTTAPPARRRRASFDYVETSALKPTSGEPSGYPVSSDETSKGDGQRDEPELDDESDSSWEDHWEPPVDGATEDLLANNDIQRAPVSESSSSVDTPIDHADVSSRAESDPKWEDTESHWDTGSDEDLLPDTIPFTPIPEDTASLFDADSPAHVPEPEGSVEAIQRAPEDSIQRTPEIPMMESVAGHESPADSDGYDDIDDSDGTWYDDAGPGEDVRAYGNEAPKETIQRAPEPQADSGHPMEPMGDLRDDGDHDAPEPDMYDGLSEPSDYYVDGVVSDSPVESVQRSAEPDQSQAPMDTGPDWHADADYFDEGIGDETLPIESIQRAPDIALPSESTAGQEVGSEFEGDNDEPVSVFEDIVDHQEPTRHVQRAPETEVDSSSGQQDVATDWDSSGFDDEDLVGDEPPFESVQRAPEPHSQQPDSWSDPMEVESEWGEDDAEAGYVEYDEGPTTEATTPVETVQRASEIPQSDGVSSMWDPDSMLDSAAEIDETPGAEVQRAPELPADTTTAPVESTQSHIPEPVEVTDPVEPPVLEGLDDEVAWEPEWVTDMGAAMPKPLNAVDDYVQRDADLFFEERNDAEVDWGPDVEFSDAAEAGPPEHVQRMPEPQEEDYYYADSVPSGEEHSMDLFSAMVDAGIAEPPPRGRAPSFPPPADIARKPEPQDDDDSYAIVPHGYDDETMITDITSISPPPAEISPHSSEAVISRAPAEEPPYIAAPQPEIQHTAPPPEVTRDPSIASGSVQRIVEPIGREQAIEQETEESGADQDIDKLARNVYRVLRDRLRIERERSDRLHGRR